MPEKSISIIQPYRSRGATGTHPDISRSNVIFCTPIPNVINTSLGMAECNHPPCVMTPQSIWLILHPAQCRWHPCSWLIKPNRSGMKLHSLLLLFFLSECRCRANNYWHSYVLAHVFIIRTSSSMFSGPDQHKSAVSRNAITNHWSMGYVWIHGLTNKQTNNKILTFQMLEPYASLNRYGVYLAVFWVSIMLPLFSCFGLVFL